jgi:ABC-type transport system involved in multi-copper enzyme maturation permease subunit
MTALLVAFRSAFFDAARPGRMAGAVGMVLFCLVTSLVWRFVGSQSGASPEALYGQYAQVVLYRVLALVSAVAAVSVVAQEVENNTLIYLLGRTLGRVQIFAARVLAAWAAAALALAAAFVISGAVILQGGSWVDAGALRDLAVMAAGSLAYVALFALIGIHLRKALLISLFIAFAWEGLVPSLPAMRVVSLGSYLRDLGTHQLGDDPGVLAVFALAVKDPFPQPLAWAVVLGVGVGCIALGAWMFRTMQHSPKDEAD